MRNNEYVYDASSLVTSHEARRAGFLEIALHRSREATQYIDCAKALHANIKQHTKCASEILGLGNIRAEILAAAGISAKALAQLSEADKESIAKDFVDRVLVPAGSGYIDELVYRYLLSLGDQLGGKMRNMIGKIANAKLCRNIVAALKIAKFEFEVNLYGKRWSKKGDAECVKAIRWLNGDQHRTMLFNVTIPSVAKNVDFVIVRRKVDGLSKDAVNPIIDDKNNFLVAGELKGGIDPAGADEHWKTARAALQRIRDVFRSRISEVFIGGAIEKSMAEEIIGLWGNSDLDNAANLNDEHQLAALCEWMIRQ